jgi:hypothetical protein
MFRRKKQIPKLAVAALALTGCTDDGGGGDLASSLLAFCMNVDSCYVGTTTGECIDTFYNNYRPYIDLDADCEAALISYLDCGTKLSCPEMMATNNRCDPLFDAAVDECEPVP